LEIIERAFDSERGLAIFIDAPFCFDLLSQVMNLGNAGRQPVSYDKNQ